MNAHPRETVALDNTDADIMQERLQQLEQDNRQLQRKLEQQAQDLARVCGYMEQLRYHLVKIETSLAWRLGYRAVSTAKRMLGRRSGENVFYEIHQILNVYHHWKKSCD
jgi:hypothetical protein